MIRVPRWTLVLAVTLAACAPTAPAATPTGGSSAPAKPQYADNQSLTAGIGFIAVTMDPHLSTSGTVRRHEIFESLILLDNNGNAKPLLATDWKTIDSTTWRFNLRKDSKFQDGTAVTADDVVFSWDRVSNGKIRSPIPGNMTSVATITKVDDYAVDVKTKVADPLLPKRFYYLAIVPKAYIEKVGDQEFALKPMGSGPFQLKEFKADDRITVTAWKEHPWRKPILQTFTIRAVPDNNARLQGLQLGELDFIYQIQNDQVAKATDLGMTIAKTPAAAVTGGFLDTVGGNGVEPGPLVSKQVRQAINYAVDRDALAKTVYAGVQQPTSLIIQPGSVGYNPDLKPYTFDRAKAKQLMAEAGYASGFKTQIGISPTSPESTPTALYVQSMLKEIGIDAEVVTYDASTFVQSIYKQRAISPIFLGSNGTGPFYDADVFLTWFWSKNRSFGSRFNNPQFDAVYEASQSELDPARREKLLKDAAAILHEDIPWLSLTTAQAIGAAKKDVGGEWFRLDLWPLLDEVYRTK